MHGCHPDQANRVQRILSTRQATIVPTGVKRIVKILANQSMQLSFSGMTIAVRISVTASGDSFETTMVIVWFKNVIRVVSIACLKQPTFSYCCFRFFFSDYDPCADKPHTLWRRCILNSGPTCFIDYCIPKGFPEYTRSTCACKPGYALNLKGDCIKTTSTECKKLAKKKACLTPPIREN
jgi:hypothetical protein